GVGMPAPDSEVVESVQVEVDRVVDLVIDHVLSRSEESLAVVALNARHADRVREAVAQTAQDSSALAELFGADAPEPFTVVSVEGAPGPRRATAILTLGYGKTPRRRVSHRFRAVPAPHGEALLVDARGARR